MHGGSSPPSGTGRAAARGRSLGPEAASETARPARGEGRFLALIGVLGLNAWASVAALPAWQLLRAGDLGLPAGLLSGLAPVPLAAGLLLLRSRSARAPWLLSLAFPLALLLPAVAQASVARSSVLSPLAVALASVGLAGYLVAVSWVTSRMAVAPIEAQSAPTEAPGHLRGARVLQVALPLCAGLAAAAAIAGAHLRFPLLDADSREESRQVVASAAALVLWSSVFLVVIAPAARRPRLGPLPLPSRGAAIVWALVLAIAVAMLLVSER